MKGKIKRLAGYLIPLVLLLAVLAWAGTTHLGNLNLSGTLAVTGASTLTGALTASTAPITCGSASIIKTMVFAIDSIGYDDIHAIFTLERGITVLRADVFCSGDAVGTNDCIVLFNSSGDSCAVTCTTSGVSGSSTTDVAFAAAQTCTLQTIDGTAGTGGTEAYLVIQYTDD